MLADRADELDVAARLDLDLHPAIALGQVGLDGLEQLDDRGIKADGEPRLDAQADLLVDGPQKLGDRRMVGLPQQVPEGVLGAGRREPAPLPGRRRARRWPRESRSSDRSGWERSGRGDRPSSPPACPGNSRSRRPWASSPRGRGPRTVSTVTRIASLTATSPPEIRNGSFRGIWRCVNTTRSIGSVAIITMTSLPAPRPGPSTRQRAAGPASGETARDRHDATIRPSPGGSQAGTSSHLSTQTLVFQQVGTAQIALEGQDW